eukprot:Platyproteum_vivax@DN1198_c0_g1_i1.p1
MTFDLTGIKNKKPWGAGKATPFVYDFDSTNHLFGGGGVGTAIVALGVISKEADVTALPTTQGKDALWTFTLRTDKAIPVTSVIHIVEKTGDFDWSKCDTGKDVGGPACVPITNGKGGKYTLQSQQAVGSFVIKTTLENPSIVGATAFQVYAKDSDGVTHSMQADLPGVAITQNILVVTAQAATTDNKVAGQQTAVYTFKLSTPAKLVGADNAVYITNDDLNFTSCAKATPPANGVADSCEIIGGVVKTAKVTITAPSASSFSFSIKNVTNPRTAKSALPMDYEIKKAGALTHSGTGTGPVIVLQGGLLVGPVLSTNRAKNHKGVWSFPITPDQDIPENDWLYITRTGSATPVDFTWCSDGMTTSVTTSCEKSTTAANFAKYKMKAQTASTQFTLTTTIKMGSALIADLSFSMEVKVDNGVTHKTSGDVSGGPITDSIKGTTGDAKAVYRVANELTTY